MPTNESPPFGAVLKVGGSLYVWPALGPALRQYRRDLGEPALLIPGGGAMVDAIRMLDGVHRLGEEKSHWLALEALDAAGRFLQSLVPDASILRCSEFARADDKRPGSLPHSWQATSDSLAARAAQMHRVRRLILLKSADPPADWLHHPEYVDPLFAGIVAAAGLAPEAVNLRRWWAENGEAGPSPA